MNTPYYKKSSFTCFDEFKLALSELKDGEYLYTKVCMIFKDEDTLNIYKYSRKGYEYICTDLIERSLFEFVNCKNLKDALNLFVQGEEIISEEEANTLIMLKELNK